MSQTVHGWNGLVFFTCVVFKAVQLVKKVIREGTVHVCNTLQTNRDTA